MEARLTDVARIEEICAPFPEPGDKDALVTAQPEDAADWDEVGGLATDAYLFAAPRPLAEKVQSS